jgi:hypothetical protein
VLVEPGFSDPKPLYLVWRELAALFERIESREDPSLLARSLMALSNDEANVRGSLVPSNA